MREGRVSTSTTSSTTATETRSRPPQRLGRRRDVYYAKARNYNSSLEASLFPDNVPVAVYDNLIEVRPRRTCRRLYRYYDLRRKR